jgi:pimeloyl-ACP methyl ester carboxylesterase
VVVLVHGFSVPGFIWDPTFAFLAQSGYRVLRYDLFGRGYSDRSKVRYDLDLFTRQLVDLLDALEVDRCRALFGLSMGGVISADFAVRFPDRLEKLVLVDPAGFPLDVPLAYKLLLLPGVGEAVFGSLSRKRLEAIIGGSIFDPSEVALVIDRYRPQMAIKGFRRAILSTMRSGVAERGIPVYRQLGRREDLPVLLFWGERDRTVPFHFSKVFLSLVPHTEFHPIAGAGHIPHYQQSDQVNPIIQEFLHEQ